ncbi:MAE_28990/MAE_18760 family HEPN-like nuclease [Catellatospora chokoriensis]|uniref:MAE-28990/MAE-18760-like HEPN domain-containing protein n=1 Tax=Catellatospora chokoriensis TaxID=310353 RepID=A0A8J3K480_9ACTN|nr:MAE_28990/MAE_18760 family HEPN-like nuclease [Catellatospora chokoriensis]GIF90018.1 hypothetical protein Cch02nite_34620 [Catellatospora chokoriensis]
MNATELRALLEEDLSWRIGELRHLRNSLLGDLDRDDWPASALRAILVMQYAHLEGFARYAFTLYVDAINSRSLPADVLQTGLFASACIPEFDAVRLGPGNDQESEHGRLTRRAQDQVAFVEKVRSLHKLPLQLDAKHAVAMDMNFGRDVLRRTLFRLAIPEDKVRKSYYESVEFVRRTRNDISHGSRKEKIPLGEFESNVKQCEQFMNDLAALITAAVQGEWYMITPSATAETN